MEEIDNIIIHSLRQIGCNIDENITNLSNFSPELLVKTISKCLLLIKPSIELPDTLPAGMAQRYSVTTTLADACNSVGFQGDIGYQTFLYSNVIEVRRVYMFLIERLPKESEKLVLIQPTDKISTIEQQISHNIRLQLNAAWTPQYCKKFGIRKFGNIFAVQASNHGFNPQKLNIPHITRPNISQELREYWLKRSPNLFQQTKNNNLCSSLIHKNDIDRHERNQNFTKLINTLNEQPNVGGTEYNSAHRSIKMSREHIRNIQSIQELTLNNIEIPNQNDIVSVPEISPVDALNFDIEKLKQSIEQGVINCKTIMTKISDIKDFKIQEEQKISKLKETKKIKERTHILLENPEVNIIKMGTVLKSSEERLKKLAEQWDAHRLPLMEQLEKSQKLTSHKYLHSKNIMDQIKLTREKSEEIEDDLKNKIAIHVQLVNEFANVNRNKNRNAYTSRILEIIGNIRKQKSDIDRVLMDTRGLQKEINNISGQLDRQFTVTDDLLFKTAKKDEHSKKAYKYLANLHANCSELINLVQETGAIMREVRDLEDQIDQEKARNGESNLDRITNDLKLVEEEGKELQERYRSISNDHVN